MDTKKLTFPEKDSSKQIQFTKKDLIPFQYNFTSIWVGGINTGKTHAIAYMCKNVSEFLSPPPDLIIIATQSPDEQINKLAKELENIVIYENGKLPTTEDLIKSKTNKLVILEDFDVTAGENYMRSMFTHVASHTNTALVCVLHSLYDNAAIRLARRNASYFVLFYFFQLEPIKRLAFALFPKKQAEALLAAYKRYVIDEPYGSLYINCTNTCNPFLRVRAHLFSPKETVVIHLPGA